MQSVQYEAPTSLAQAAQTLQGRSDAKILAGGTDLLVQMKLGIGEPALDCGYQTHPGTDGVHSQRAGLARGRSGIQAQSQ